MTGTDRQQEAITSHQTSLMISAGAGTGKTFVLVNKYLNLLETFGAEMFGSPGAISVLNILTLTFTEKAAAEMKERIRGELERKNGEFWEKSRLEFLIAPVQTFHSFCASVLREFAFEAGLEPSFVVLDERDFSRIFERSFQDLIHTQVEGEEQSALVCTLSLVGPHTLEKMFRYLYARRDESEQFFTRFKEDQNDVISQWEDEIRIFKEAEVQNIRKDPYFLNLVQSLLAFAYMEIPSDDKAMIYLQKVRPCLETLQDESTAEEFLLAGSTFVKETLRGGTKTNWSKEILNELRETNKALIEYLKQISYLSRLEFRITDPFSDLTIRFLQALGIAFHRFCGIMDREKSHAGGMDFTDLIRYTRFLFQTRRDLVASYYAKRYRYLLIDEFQDTDPAQFEIVMAIMGKPSPDVQGLFIVGDPKQSIYLFRDADVTRFHDAQELITGPCGGKNIPLDVCFRSAPAVVTFVNHLFSQLFHSAEKPWEFTYDAIKVSKERAEHTGSVTLMLIRKDCGLSEYEAIAGQIEEMIRDETQVYEEGSRDHTERRTFATRPARYGDMAILLERRTNLGLVIHSLACRNIPYYVQKGTGFYHRQEILDLISLLSVLHRPYDSVHLVGLLRSPYFGFSDLDILQISRCQGHTFLEKLHHSGTDHPEYERVDTLISRWQGKAGRMRLVPLIRSILEESGIQAVYGGLVENSQIFSNIEKFLTIIRTREESGRYQLSDLVPDLLDALDRQEEEGEAMVDDPDLNAVTIMTIHASKGLEYPIVFVPEMAVTPNLNQDPILMDCQKNLLGVILPNPEEDFVSARTPIYTVLKKELDKKLLAEKRRLLYVALTRAADHLIMSGEIGDQLPDGTHQTRLDWIMPTLGITGNTIEAGMINYQTEEGPGFVRILTPTPPDREYESEKPPLVIPADLKECHGRFVRTSLSRSIIQEVPFLVTDIAKHLNTRKTFKEESEEGEGAVFGSAIHEVLRGRDPEQVIREFGIEDENQQAQLYTALEEFHSLPGMSGASDIKRELAFTVNIAGFTLTGRIDLLSRCNDGTWMVIDYKSEHIQVEDLAKKEPYQFQVEIYRRAAEIFGFTPVRGALYSVYEKKLIELESWSEKKIAEVLITTCSYDLDTVPILQNSP